MGYIGNQASSNFSSLAKQVITGNGGTTYTLSTPVANANELEIFVNNVRQEPAVAYNATGTALTMTGAVASTDDFYVVYQGKAVQTVVPPDGSVTSAKLDTNIAIAGTLSTVGSVGIGTTSPPDHLSVVTSGSNAQLSVDRSDGGAGRTVLIHSSTGGQLQTTGSVPLLFGTADIERMRIDASGKVGIGTSTIPTADSMVTVRKDGAANEFNILSGTSHASVINMGDADDYNIQRIKADNSSNSLQFQANNVERMRIDDLGRVTIGHNAAINIGMLGVSNRASGNSRMVAVHNAAGTSGYFNQIAFRNNADSATIGEIVRVNDASVSYNTTSDYRLKTAVNYDWDATTRLKQLKPARFEWIADGDDAVPVDGFLAHEAQAVVPEAVTGTKDEVDNDGNLVMQGIDQSKLVPLLVKTIQELEARITALEAS